MCEFTPREIILAAGAVGLPVGGSAATILAEQFLPANLCPFVNPRSAIASPEFRFESGGFDRCRNDLRRKKENVRGADERDKTDVCARTATKGRWYADAFKHWTRELKEHLEQRSNATPTGNFSNSEIQRTAKRDCRGDWPI